MLYARVVFVLLAVAVAGAAAFQDKDQDKKEDKTPPKLKGFLPANFKKLGLSEAQVQKIYKVQGEYKEKLEELERTKRKLKAEEKEAVEKVLTPEQVKELNRIRTGEKKDK